MDTLLLEKMVLMEHLIQHFQLFIIPTVRVELEDENGEKEEFAILEEVDFEGRHFAVLAPLAEVQAQSEAGADADAGLSLEIFEVADEMFTPLEDDELANRLMAHLDELAAKLAEDEKD